MKMLKWMVLTIGIVNTAFSIEKVCIKELKSVNVADEFVNSSVEVLKARVLSEGSREVVVIDESTKVTCDHYMNLTFIRLGEVVQLSAQIVPNGDMSQQSSNMYKAATPDDLNPIMGQIALMVSDEDFTPVESIYMVSRSQSNRLRKKRSTDYFSVHFGNTAFLTPTEANTFGVGGAMVWDNRDYIGEIEASFMMFGGVRDVNFMSLGANVMFPFSSDDKSFYTGGGFGVGSITSPKYDPEATSCYPVDSSNDGCYDANAQGSVLLTGNVGYIIGRTSDFTIRFQMEGKAGLIQVNNEYPLGGSLKMVVGFE